MIGEITQLQPDPNRRRFAEAEFSDREFSDREFSEREFLAERAWRYLAPSATGRFRPVPVLQRSEMLLVGLLISVFVAAQIAVAGPTILYNRTCWMDEYITQLLVSDPSVGHSVEAVRHGVYSNPPVYDLLSRALVRLSQLVCEAPVRTTLRLFSTACVVGAILSAYAILRKAFTVGASIIALLTVLPHPQLVEQMFDAGSYAPLLGAALALALSFQLKGQGRSSSFCRVMAIGLSAVMLCTLQYSGALILVVLTAAAMLTETGSVARRVWRVAPALAGLAALLMLLPIAQTQAAGLTNAMPLKAFSARAAREFLTEIFYPLPLLVVLAGWCVGNVFRQTELPIWQSRAAKRRATVPLLSLAIVPVGMLIGSALVHSPLKPAYALVATFAIAPVAAMLASSLRPRELIGIAVPLAIMGFMQIFGTARMHGEVQRITTGEAALARHDVGNVPIIFADRGDAMELADVAPDLVPRIHVVDERQAPFIQLSNQHRYDLEMMRKARAFYATPQLLTPTQLASFDRVRIIAGSDDLSRLLQEVPMRRIGEHLFEPISAPYSTR